MVTYKEKGYPILLNKSDFAARMAGFPSAEYDPTVPGAEEAHEAARQRFFDLATKKPEKYMIKRPLRKMRL